MPVEAIAAINYNRFKQAAPKTKVAVVGGGSVGASLAHRLVASGKFSVTIAARDVAKTITKLGEANTLPVAAIDEVVATAKVVILAVNGEHSDEGVFASRLKIKLKNLKAYFFHFSFCWV